jgi:hypothetical protein
MNFQERKTFEYMPQPYEPFKRPYEANSDTRLV